MAQKIITELPLRDNVTDEVNFSTDDGTQSYRVTAAQLLAYILATGNVGNAAIASNAISTAKMQDEATTLAKLEAAVQAALVPVGAVLPFAGSSAPTGFLICDGSQKSRTTYQALFDVIGVTHGYGDQSTTFNLPDYRGRFMRGVSGSATVDPDRTSRSVMATGGNSGNNVGSIQADAHQNLTGTFRMPTSTAGWSAAPTGGFAAAGDGTGLSSGSPAGSGYKLTLDASTVNRTSTETRPSNAYVNYIIKF